MSITDGKFEIYVVGYSDMDIPNKKYVESILNENNFNLTESVENCDIIYMTSEFSHTIDGVLSKECAEILNLDIAESLNDLLTIREESQIREWSVK